MRREYLIGVDLGSTAMKAVAVSDGQILARAQCPMRYYSDGTVFEFDAEDYYEDVAGLLRSLSREIGPEGICSGLTVVCASGNLAMFREGKPVRPIISWMDDRGDEAMKTFFPDYTEESVSDLVGWHLAPKFPLVQLAWVAKENPEQIAQADRICEASCYINYRLSGNWAMDHSTATTFYLQDQKKLAWDKKTYSRLGIRKEQLPELIAVGDRIGTVSEKAAEETGLAKGTPVFAGCYDGASAARAIGVEDEHQMLISCGTSWVCIYPSKERADLVQAGLMIDPYLEGKLWIGMTSLGECGRNVQEALSKILAGEKDQVEAFNRYAKESIPGSHGLLIDPMRFSETEAPEALPKADACRAVMEGIVFSLKKQREMTFAGKKMPQIRQICMVGGASNSPVWPQIVSDVFERPVRVAFGSDATALGAVLIAGVGNGKYPDFTTGGKDLALKERIYQPDHENSVIYRKAYDAFCQHFPGREYNMH